MKIKTWISRGGGSWGIASHDQEKHSCCSCVHSSVCYKLKTLRDLGEEIVFEFNCGDFIEDKLDE